MHAQENEYDYREITVKNSMVSLYKEAYRRFGWVLISDEKNQHTTLRFRRERMIRNKAELTRLQRNFDACVEELSELEEAKTDTASKAGFGVSIVGSLFLCCSVLLSVASEMAVSILVAIPGVLGWLSPGFLYKLISKKKTEEMEPLIEQKYDEIHRVCQKADGLTDCE